MKPTTLTIDVLSEDYPDKALDQNQAQLINMYLEPGQVRSAGKYKVVAYPTPGLVVFKSTSYTTIRALKEYNEVLYGVGDNKFFSAASNGDITEIGTLNTSTGFAKIETITGGSDINNQIIIIDGTNGYTYNIDTAVATFPITDEDFPDDATDMTAQDDYVVVSNPTSLSYNVSNLSDTTTWDALDFASKISKPDNLVGLHSHKKRIWLFGSRSSEVIYNSGNALFPFENVGEVLLNYGLAAKEAKVTCEDLLFFFAQSADGGYSFQKITDFIPQPISSVIQETIINNMTTVDDCKAYSYKRDGHTFIDWLFPTEDKTFTYDVTTNAWLRRQSNILEVYGKFLGNCSAFCYNKALIGSVNSGVIYYQTNSSYTDVTAIRRQIVTPPLYKDGKRIFIHRLQIDVETNVGSNKTFTLEMSNDSGRTWETVETFTIPSDNKTQLYTSSLGSAYDFIFRITTTMNANFIVLGVIADISIGAN
jgi:hypothetical protein